MIRIRRGRAPNGWRRIEASELTRIQALVAAGKPLEFGTAHAHEGLREKLFEQQHWKCCYCEIQIREVGSAVEHFRPKGRAFRGAGLPRHGYWWLAWDWDNLFFACGGCNGTKATRFPLASGSAVLAPGQKRPYPEQALLLDPASRDPAENPHDLIKFVRVRRRWRPVPRKPDPRAATTIRTLRLDGPDLLEHYEKYVQKTVQPLVDDVLKGAAASNAAEVDHRWYRLTGMLFHDHAPFLALAHDAVEHLIPPGVRRQFGLRLPRV